jgi:hypothetical protein
MALTKVSFSMINGMPVSALDYGVVGDGVTDDTVAFTNAVAAAISRQRALDISGLKIYLASQSASITTTGLFLQGNGQPQAITNYNYMSGDGSAFSSVITNFNLQFGSAIISRYNGAIFTGKTFYGDNFSVLGDPSKANSKCFDTGVPASYPGWSQAITQLTNFSAFYFGSDGFRLQGGLEVTTLNNVNVWWCLGYCVNIYETVGVDSPIQYINWTNSSINGGLLGNIFLNGVSNSITLDNCNFNSSGQLDRLAAGGFVITTASQIVYGVKMSKKVGATAYFDVQVVNCFVEASNGIATFTGGLQSTLVFANNFMFPYDISWPYFFANFDSQIFNLRTSNNRCSSSTTFYFNPSNSTASSGLSIGELGDVQFSVVFGGYTPKQTQLTPQLLWGTTATVGDETAATFTVSIPTLASWRTIGNGDIAYVATFLITASWGATNADNLGAYIMYVTKMPSGNYAGVIQATSSTSGFSSPPTLSTAGVLSIPLAQFYYARVSRIDNIALG